MKFFDRFAGIVERKFPNLIPVLQKTKLFVFPGRAHEILPRHVDSEFMNKVIDEFFLPFQYVAIEDTLSLILLWDEEKEQRGLQCTRHFIEYMEMGVPLEEADSEAERISSHNMKNWPSDEELSRFRKRVNPRTAMITHGKFSGVTLTGAIDQYGQPEVVHAYTLINGVLYDAGKDKTSSLILMLDDTDYKNTIESTVRNAWVAMKEIWHFNSPDKFILEEKPINADRDAAKAKKLGKIPRHHQRPQYTILHPQMIRQRLRLPPLAKGGPKRPHERRAHRRTFRSSKFWRMQGKTIIVPATWVGKSEAVIGKKIYRVLLDK